MSVKKTSNKAVTNETSRFIDVSAELACAVHKARNLIYYATDEYKLSRWNRGFDVKSKEVPGLIGVRFCDYNREIDILLFDGFSKNMVSGVKQKGDIFVKYLSDCSFKELSAVLDAVRKRVVKAHEMPFFDLKDSDIKSWFLDLSMNEKRLLFCFYTIDEYGRNSPVHSSVTEENYCRISNESKSVSDFEKRLDSVFCSLNSRCLFNIYSHMCIYNKYIAPVRRREDELVQHKEGIIDQNEAYREGVISVLQEAYKAARPTNEVVRGNYAREFDGEVTWSRALDFSVPGMPEIKGLRYIDFPDCTHIRLFMKDGNSKPVNELMKTELGLVRDGLQKALKIRKGIRM